MALTLMSPPSRKMLRTTGIAGPLDTTRPERHLIGILRLAGSFDPIVIDV